MLARKKKKVKLNVTTQKKLGAIHKYVTKKVRKSHIAQKSQLVNDRHYYQECEKSQRISIKSSDSKSTSSGSRKGSVSMRKRKLKAEPVTSIPPVVEMVSTPNTETSHGGSSHFNTSLHSLLPLEETNQGQDRSEPRTSVTLPPTFPLQKESNNTDKNNSHRYHEKERVPREKFVHPNIEAQKETLSKPPLVPQGKKSRKSKKTMPWISALREKQKRNKKELKIATLDDEDYRSVNTVDLETSAAESLSKNAVISIFGKKLMKQKAPQQDTDSEPESPWNVKLRSVPKQNERMFKANNTVFSPEGKKNFFHDCIQSPEMNQSSMLTGDSSELDIENVGERSPILNIYAGDVIDLFNLPAEGFGANPLIISITNNSKDDRTQVVVLGQDMLLIASRFSNQEDKLKVEKDLANVLWLTPRSEIQSLALNHNANGVSISITDGSSFPLNFKSLRECFSFVQDYYQVKDKKDLISSESDERSTLNSSMIEEDSSSCQRECSDDHTEKMIDGCSESRGESCDQSEKSNEKNMEPQKIPKPFNTEEMVEFDNNEIPSSGVKDESTGNAATGNNDSARPQTHEDQTTISRFKKMLKYNVPIDAVKHRMSLDGLPDEVAEIVLNEGRNQEEEQKGKEFITHEERSVVEKYRNMLSIGMPKDAVLHAMRKDTVEESLIATIVNSSKPLQLSNSTPLTAKQERCAKKYRLLLKTNVSLDGARRKMEFENVDQAVIENVLGKREDTSKDFQHMFEKLSTHPQDAFITPLKDTSNQSETSHTSEESVASKYRKMLKMGIPADAVRHSMTKDNVGGKIIDAVFGLESKPSNGPIPISIPLKPDSVEGVASKYKKMLKMGIPADAVRHSMAKDNVGEEIVESLFGQSSKPSRGLSASAEKVASKYKKMVKMGIPADAVRHSMAKDNVGDEIIESVFGLNSPISTSIVNKRKSRLVNIHWTKLSEDAVQNQNCIWNRSSKKPKLLPKTMDISSLEELFQKRKPNTELKGLNKDKKSQSTQTANIIDPRRAQNVAISLQAFKDFKKEDLVSIIDDMDPEHQIKGDRVLFLTGLLPTKNEAEGIERFKGNESQLVPVEKFFRLLLSVKDVNRKIKIMETMEMMNQTVVALKMGYEILRRVCEEVIKSEKLQLVLEAVLTIGNIMNEGTSTGGAAGFKFDSLLKLTQTKSIDGKMTVLDYIVSSFISRGERSVLNLSDDFPDCSTACRLQFNDMDVQTKNIATSLKICTNGKNARLKERRNVPTPGIIRLETFLTESEDDIKKLEILKDTATKSCVVCSYDGFILSFLSFFIHQFRMISFLINRI